MMPVLGRKNASVPEVGRSTHARYTCDMHARWQFGCQVGSRHADERAGRCCRACAAHSDGLLRKPCGVIHIPWGVCGTSAKPHAMPILRASRM
jgi:hypothetical protein